MKRPYDERSYFSESGYVTHEHEEALQAKATAAEESYRRSERRQRSAFFILLFVLLCIATASVIAMMALWKKYQEEPSSAVPQLSDPQEKAPLEPGQSQWKEGKLLRYSF
jgi:hypothetical protein